MRDEIELTPRQYDVLAGLAEGLTYKQIGRRLSIESTTVRSHASSAYARLGVSNAAQAVARLSGVRLRARPAPVANGSSGEGSRPLSPPLRAYLDLWERNGCPVPRLVELEIEVPERERRAMLTLLSLHMQLYRP